MAQKNQTALQKMQEIAGRLISNTPELAKMLDSDSALRPKKPLSPLSKKAKNTSNLMISSKSELTANDYHEKCKDLTSEVQNWRDKCVSLQQQIGIIKQRFVERQIQYRGIIQELQSELKSKSFLDSNDRSRMTQINDLHKEIMENIGAIQNKTSKILIEQQSDIRRFFNKKINEIKEKFKQDKINKNQKDQEYQQREKQMASELEWIKNIAHKIDQENKTLMKKYSTLKSQFQIQERDKDLLLKEILMKKKENAALRAQVEQYQKLLNQVSQQMEEGDMKSQIDNSRTSKQEQTKQKTLKSQKSQYPDIRRYQNTINHLNKVLAKQKNKIRELKNLYMKQISNKSELQGIIRKLVEDTRGSIVEAERDKTYYKKKGDEINVEARQSLLQKLLNNQKILTLIYDKTFYTSNNRQTPEPQMPEDLKRILEDQEEGFC